MGEQGQWGEEGGCSAPSGAGAGLFVHPHQKHWPLFQEPVGANPVQVEVGEFEEPTEDVEEIVAESKSLFPCPPAGRDIVPSLGGGALATPNSEGLLWEGL